MTNERFEAIMLLCKYLGFIAGGVIAVAKYFHYREVSVAEKSVGATKIKELEKADENVRNDIKHLQDVDNQHRRELDTLNTDYKTLISQVWNFMGKK